ncbi:hypothetical protein EVAR_27489_1 [Eumeta japonica]|uniref:Uncharacterized protein n=1 Tax=Eumeta variegata TaxID=151549 RepID=A0A4C1XF47_EUMVA|nr:hypothetical protein EVAR_27489_1 [Eumeta japonica]
MQGTGPARFRGGKYHNRRVVKGPTIISSNHVNRVEVVKLLESVFISRSGRARICPTRMYCGGMLMVEVSLNKIKEQLRKTNYDPGRALVLTPITLSVMIPILVTALILISFPTYPDS